VRRNLRFLLVIATAMAISVAVARATQEQGEGFYDKLKGFFFICTNPKTNPKPKKKKNHDSEANDFAKIRIIAERNTLYFPT
jgi:hypothetical protein